MKRLVTLVILIALVNLLGCGEQKSPEVKYTEAKSQAEQKLVEFSEIMETAKALERGDLSVLPSDPESLKRLSEKANTQTINKLSNELNEAMRKVSELKPEGYDDDYKQWTQEMKQRLEALK